MKKIILIIMLMPIMVIGMTCDTIDDTQTSDRRTLTCDSDLSTKTKYKTNEEHEVLKNSVCKITCSEEIVFSIDPIKKVLSGTSFNYPLYASGQRKCKATYNYEAYESKIKTLVSEYASLTGIEKQTKANEITNYYAQKKACDEFTKEGSDYENKYTYNGNVTLKLETSTSEETIPYEFKNISEYSSNVIIDEVSYDSCNYNENNRTCRNGTKTISSWTETVTIFGKYTMKDVYLEKYTGNIKNAYSNNTCNAGDRYFTSFTEVTKPVENTSTDKGYTITLTARNLGNNLVTTGTQWSLDVNCWYKVKNLIFPQKNQGGEEDESYQKYGNPAFYYRIIDLNNPFPNDREPGANWYNKEDIILSTKDNLSSLQKFVISLDRSSINRIREYNDLYPYDTFNLTEMEKSKFIEANNEIIKRNA